MTDIAPRPRIEVETAFAPRLDLPLAPSPAAPVVHRGGVGLALTGIAILTGGIALLGAGNFVAAQFARAQGLGWLSLAVAVAGLGLIGWGVWRELRGLLGLRSVDRLRTALSGQETGPVRTAARQWLAGLRPGLADPSLAAALNAVEDAGAVRALLRAGPGMACRAAADGLGRDAAFQVAAAMAAMPTPALVVGLMSWRGLRLVRQVAELHGLRPGLFGTLALLRRTMLAAGAAAITEAAVNTAAHAVLSNPLLAHLAGEMAGAGVAARRMIVLARAADAACSALPDQVA